MNSHLQKFIIVASATFALAGCALLDPFIKKETSSSSKVTPTPTTTQTETTSTTEMGSSSYKVDSASPKPESDNPEDLQKDLDAVTIESDFGLLVK